MRILLTILIIVGILAFVFLWLIPRNAPPEPDEKPTGEADPRWEPYR